MEPDRDPRLAMVAAGEFFGGAERQILNLLAALRCRDIESDLLLLHDRELAALARKLGTPTQIIGTGKRFDLHAVLELSRTLRIGSYDVVHAHGYKAMVMAGLGRARSKFALLKTEHGRVETGIGSRRERWLAGAYRKAENAMSRATKATIVYVTDELRRFYVQEHAGIDSCVIFNGIDAAEVMRLQRPVELDPGTFNVVVLGRLEHVKGVEHAIRAMSTPELAGTRLHVVGDGPLRESLEQLVRDSKLGESVTLHGFRGDGARFAAHADVLLMPSLHEGLPYTLLEAMAAGTPVAASAVGGLAEVLEHEHTALLFAPRSPQAIAAALTRLSNDAVLRSKIATTAKAVLLSRFTAEAMGAAYAALYRRLAAVSSPRSPKARMAESSPR
jgi:glycosyltransferase involved in cell wall biosynthesis